MESELSVDTEPDPQVCSRSKASQLDRVKIIIIINITGQTIRKTYNNLLKKSYSFAVRRYLHMHETYHTKEDFVIYINAVCGTIA